MTQSIDSAFQLAKQALSAVGLPDPRGLIGRTFMLESNGHWIIGSILSVGYGPAEGVSLRVSSPRLHGTAIKCIRHTGVGWTAIGETEHIIGTFELFQ